MNVSTMSAVAATEILASSDLPSLMNLSSARLGKKYRLLTDLLDRHSVSFVPCSAGTFVLARVAPHAKTWNDEDAIVGELRHAGVLVAPGRTYHVPEMGWARICFAIDDEEFQEALRRIDIVFSSLQRK